MTASINFIPVLLGSATDANVFRYIDLLLYKLIQILNPSECQHIIASFSSYPFTLILMIPSHYTSWIKNVKQHWHISHLHALLQWKGFANLLVSVVCAKPVGFSCVACDFFQTRLWEFKREKGKKLGLCLLSCNIIDCCVPYKRWLDMCQREPSSDKLSLLSLKL